MSSADNVSIEILRSFVPLNILSDDHLRTVSRDVEMDFALRGQPVVSGSDLQEKHLFLVSGKLGVIDGQGIETTVIGGTSGSSLSIADGQPNSCSVEAIEDSQIFMIDREFLDAMLCWDQVAKTLMLDFRADRQFDEDASWMQTLLESNLFHKIPPYNVKKVFDKFQSRVVQSGETIVRQGEQGDECFIIKEGVALVSYAEDDSSDPQIVAELLPGRCFGEDALLNKTTRNATVIMETNGVLMCLRKQDFFSLLAEPKVENLNFDAAAEEVHQGAQWLDVRSQQEFDIHHRTGAFHLPMHLMSLKSRLMDSKKTYIAYCSTGRRASTAAYLLSQQGYNVVALGGAVPFQA